MMLAGLLSSLEQQQQQRRRRRTAAAASPLALALVLLLLQLAAAAASPRRLLQLQPADDGGGAGAGGDDDPTLAPLPVAGGISTRIVGGRAAPFPRLSHQAGAFTNPYICGAVMLAPHVAITASHCEPRAGVTRVTAGVESNAWFRNVLDTSATAARVLNHPYNVKSRLTYDASLVFLSTCPDRVLEPNSELITYAQVASQSEADAAASSTWLVSGWGATSKNASPVDGQGGFSAQTLQYGLLGSWPRGNCSAALGLPAAAVTDDMIW